LGWTSHNQLETEQSNAQVTYDSTFGKFVDMSAEDLAKDPEAMKMGSRLFMNNCSLCHGSDASGNFGFPNLTDNDWLYGGTPDRIKESINLGRQGVMPAWGTILGEASVGNVVEYVLKSAGEKHDEAKAALGASIYNTNCVACHGADGKGNPLVGAPNLVDDVWLYGAGKPEELAAVLRQTVRNGRNGVMPAHAETLKPERIHLLAAYVYSLSQQEDARK
jgi:cytochrome c oxidase cbb3-type subunit 3